MNATSSETKVKAWSPATPCKIPDNIISSQFTNAKLFVPSYEKNQRPCIEQLLTNEYQRMWWHEKTLWQKIQTSRMPSKKILQRTVIRRKPAAQQPVIAVPKKPRKPKQKEKPKKDVAVEKTEEDPAKKTEENPAEKTEEDPVEETVDCPCEKTVECACEKTERDSLEVAKRNTDEKPKGNEQAKDNRKDKKPVTKKEDKTK